MKKILVALMLSLSIFSLNAQEHLKIKGVEIDGNKRDMVAALKNKGLTYSSFSTPESTVLEGNFANLKNCKFILITTENDLVCKVAVMSEFYDSWKSLKRDYDFLKESFNDKYGPGNSYESFASPYYDGDGYEFQAFQLGKAICATFYTVEEGMMAIQIQTSASGTEMYIRVVYEDKINTEILKAEQDLKVSEDI